MYVWIVWEQFISWSWCSLEEIPALVKKSCSSSASITVDRNFLLLDSGCPSGFFFSASPELWSWSVLFLEGNPNVNLPISAERKCLSLDALLIFKVISKTQMFAWHREIPSVIGCVLSSFYKPVFPHLNLQDSRYRNNHYAKWSLCNQIEK